MNEEKKEDTGLCTGLWSTRTFRLRFFRSEASVIKKALGFVSVLSPNCHCSLNYRGHSFKTTVATSHCILNKLHSTIGFL